MAREVAHPNVVKVYDIGQLADGEVFLSMEFIDGEDLASLLRAPADSRVKRPCKSPGNCAPGWAPRTIMACCTGT